MPARSDGHLSHLELRGNLAVGHAIHEDTLHDGALGGGQPIHHLHDLLELPVYILIVKLGEVQLLQAMQVKELLRRFRFLSSCRPTFLVIPASHALAQATSSSVLRGFRLATRDAC